MNLGLTLFLMVRAISRLWQLHSALLLFVLLLTFIAYDSFYFL